jgi:UDP:flavonoid glycosyltransferase YjiC (YdhE family)
VTARSIAVFAMPEPGHVSRLLPLVAGLARRGATVHVFSDARFEDAVARAGGRFVDLFEGRPLDAADAESRPIPCRYVSFAGVFAEEVAREAKARSVSLVLHDTFAVVGPVVARLLGVPHVNACAGHAVEPRRFLAALRTDPRVAVSERCLHAVERLRSRFGMADASPFSYVTALSPTLNVYGEPEPFLDAETRRAFEPVAFFGSLPDPEEIAARARAAPAWPDAPGSPRVYACLGTVGWRYYDREMRHALASVADALSRVGARARVSLGRREAPPGVAAALARPGVEVVSHADQWGLLAGADAFVTHHGLNSTHEAVFHRVPMLSYPLFWDQPALAKRCRALGIATPLSDSPRAPLDPARVAAALEDVLGRRDAIRERLSEARRWEEETIARRPDVLSRILALA